ncbi:alpha/beta hydrolase, partial [Balneolaceae bacterium ANBcel3]|nr:alpha/beta hydrolase [Balneolaceae bacterium ANBcel3]
YSKSWIDVNYAVSEEVYHTMDVYLPTKIQDSYPAVFLIYGSAWFGNNLKHTAFHTLGEPLLDAGFAVITPNHRASTDSVFPAQIHDIKGAIRYIRANATSYHIDTTFIGISGISSGGHLAAMAGTTGSVSTKTSGEVTFDLEGKVGGNTNYSSSVHAVVNWFGPTDLLIMGECEGGGTVDHYSPDAPESILIGSYIHDNHDKGLLANPITYVHSSNPPFLIFHGAEDPLVPPCQSELLHEALMDHDVQSIFYLVEDGKHGPGVHTDENLEIMTNFFIQQLENINR